MRLDKQPVLVIDQANEHFIVFEKSFEEERRNHVYLEQWRSLPLS
ncbi:MAG: hypothetical protein ACYCWN_11395 [Ferrimicrobium sp.]|jgi:hypothetical protein|uniref:Uncharacterized protein n=1 Tax=Ferrimicrobium acidiphilum TaxID=121039 RepID=A0ABV3Y4G8_9ACTN|nr:hypothetical protein [Ferrimicrobium sp.]